MPFPEYITAMLSSIPENAEIIFTVIVIVYFLTILLLLYLLYLAYRTYDNIKIIKDSLLITEIDKADLAYLKNFFFKQESNKDLSESMAENLINSSLFELRIKIRNHRKQYNKYGILLPLIYLFIFFSFIATNELLESVGPWFTIFLFFGVPLIIHMIFKQIYINKNRSIRKQYADNGLIPEDYIITY